jgi:hypothetical protein
VAGSVPWRTLATDRDHALRDTRAATGMDESDPVRSGGPFEPRS